jgi:hypothetical protein
VIDRLEAGKMADSRILMDTLGMLQQLGGIPRATPGKLSLVRAGGHSAIIEGPN